MANECWSNELRALTKRMIETLDIVPLGDGVPFKHVDGHASTISLDDFISGHLRVVDRGSGDVTVFADADALIAAGWAID